MSFVPCPLSELPTFLWIFSHIIFFKMPSASSRRAIQRRLYFPPLIVPAASLQRLEIILEILDCVNSRLRINFSASQYEIFSWSLYTVSSSLLKHSDNLFLLYKCDTIALSQVDYYGSWMKGNFRTNADVVEYSSNYCIEFSSTI